ncbi:MAG: hypothetical protein LC113_10685 [Acidobacteria bacterium]|nr:hypothetical protein [Acidobacteriota bacterium]
MKHVSIFVVALALVSIAAAQSFAQRHPNGQSSEMDTKCPASVSPSAGDWKLAIKGPVSLCVPKSFKVSNRLGIDQSYLSAVGEDLELDVLYGPRTPHLSNNPNLEAYKKESVKIGIYWAMIESYHAGNDLFRKSAKIDFVSEAGKRTIVLVSSRFRMEASSKLFDQILGTIQITD